MSKEITSRAQDYSKWNNDLVVKGSLADHSDVKGCMVIKPYGFALWENMRDQLDWMFKDTGHVNAYFPLFIPKSFLSKEAAHVEGFAKECAVVTHYRLKNDPNGGGIIVDPEAKLEEEHTESHLYGLYLAAGQQLVDNHTLVDHQKPFCLSNELYKGVLLEQSTGVFNGKVYVHKDAQKTNAFQQNNNLVISKKATIDSKPQLEIFADDVVFGVGDDHIILQINT